MGEAEEARDLDGDVNALIRDREVEALGVSARRCILRRLAGQGHSPPVCGGVMCCCVWWEYIFLLICWNRLCEMERVDLGLI